MSGTDFVDLYEALGVQPDAGVDVIRAAIKATRKIWVLRQNAPALERRQEAETVLERVGEAERVLLDADLRAAFDVRRREHLEAVEVEKRSAVVPDWIATAREAMQRGDVRRAAWAAREATHANPRDPEAWAARGRADRALGRLDDATYELEEASKLEAGSAKRHYEFASVLHARRLFGPAIGEYSTALRLAPGEAFYRTALGRGLIDAGRAAEGVKVLEPLAQARPDDDWAQESLAWGLCETGLSHWQRMRTGPPLCLSREAADASLAVWRRAQALPFRSQSVRDRLNGLVAEAEQAKRKRWAMSGRNVALLLLLVIVLSIMSRELAAAASFVVFWAGIAGIIALGRKPQYAIQARNVRRISGPRT